eukprot:4513353-Prymnesium_polylepis.1
MAAMRREHAELVQALRREHAESTQAMRREHTDVIAKLQEEVQQSKTLRVEVGQLRVQLADALREQIATVKVDVARMNGLLVLRQGLQAGY